MSDSVEKHLSEITKTLKSIDERLGLLLLPRLGEIEDSSTSAAKDLFIKQESLSHASSSVEGEMDAMHTQWTENLEYHSNRFHHFWKIDHPSSDLDADELSSISTGLTFCDFAKLLEPYGLTKNRNRRYTNLRKEFNRIRGCEWRGAIQAFMEGEKSPSKIRIDFHTADVLLDLVEKLIKLEVFSLPGL